MTKWIWRPRRAVTLLLLDQPADAEGDAGCDMLLGDVARAVEIKHIVLEREEDERGRARAGHDKGSGKGEAAALFRGHRACA